MDIIRDGCFFRGSEADMEKNVVMLLKAMKYRNLDFEQIEHQVVTQVKIRSLRVIPDIIIVHEKKLIAVECKLTQWDSVINQAIVHKSWADYSYVCMPHGSYMPISSAKHMTDNGIGFIRWVHEWGLVEGIPAAYNPGRKKSLRDEARQAVMDKIKRTHIQVKEDNQIKFKW